MRGLVNAMYAPTTVVGERRAPCPTPPGVRRDGTRGREPTDMPCPSYGSCRDATNARSCGLSGTGDGHNGGVPTTLEPEVIDPDVDSDPDPGDRAGTDRPWIVIVWNDPVNLMSYVTYVFQKLFGYSLEKATELMLDVHQKGKAIVASGNREEGEMHVFRLHEHSLWATMEHDD